MAKVLIRINDGFTLKGTIPARFGLPEVKISYRPALPEDVYEYFQVSSGADGKTKMRAVVALLMNQLVGWDIDGETDASVPAPISEETIRRVPQPILVKITDFLLGYHEAREEAKN